MSDQLFGPSEVCDICGKRITRKRGNLRTMESWRRAVANLAAKHERKCRAAREAAAGQEGAS